MSPDDGDRSYVARMIGRGKLRRRRRDRGGARLRTPMGNGSVENRVAQAGMICREFAARRGSSQRELPGRRTD